MITIYTLSLTQDVVGKTLIEIFVTIIVVGTDVPTMIFGTAVPTRVGTAVSTRVVGTATK